MREPVRIGLRLLGLLLFLVGVGAIVLLVTAGPGEIADRMGDSCAHRRHGPSEQCNILDVLELLWLVPVFILVGGVMALALRPQDKGPITIDLTWIRRNR